MTTSIGLPDDDDPESDVVVSVAADVSIDDGSRVIFSETCSEACDGKRAAISSLLSTSLLLLPRGIPDVVYLLFPPPILGPSSFSLFSSTAVFSNFTRLRANVGCVLLTSISRGAAAAISAFD
eukprot:CAMPEP_0205958990 /NCGR_PEP_ID=MMETSP1459-20131121/53579_1 /ASSEMBLY_ACC=CAM_ASM_001120 /TAXON_ID=41880 /ORGANISM="Pycnococcus provasolii, Strain RCC931" /LENGTH=122 /DNA_ID=CAMNT_0053331557 /DNA_START=89 /DNA_END=454 /DNA_ORIENTATION=-